MKPNFKIEIMKSSDLEKINPLIDSFCQYEPVVSISIPLNM